jgi:exopolysaccharide production protein ExoQ
MLTTAMSPTNLTQKLKSMDKKLVFSSILFFSVFAGQFYRNLIGWQGFGIVCIGLIVFSIIVFKSNITQRKLQNIPFALILFIIWCSCSILWSQYPATTLLGTGIQLATVVPALLAAMSLSWHEVLYSLSKGLQWILGLSLIFELYVALFIKERVFSTLPPITPWSDNLLFNGGPIQGIVGNRNLISFIALLLIICICIQAYEKTIRKLFVFIWLGLSLLTLFLTASATISISLIALSILVLLVFLLRTLLPQRHKVTYFISSAFLLVSLALFVVFSSTIFNLFGRDSSASGRQEIWTAVFHLIEEHPFLGWGWMGYWAPWVQPFDSLAVINKVVYLQAHNGILDIWMQTGIVGATIALVTAIVTSVRAWRIAVSPINKFMNTEPVNIIVSSSASYIKRNNTRHFKQFGIISLLPVLLLAALLIQSITESRILIEGNFFLLVLLAYKVKEHAPPYGSLRRSKK